MLLNPKLVDTIKANFADKGSEELRAIAQSNDLDRWSPEALEAARALVDDRASGRAPEPKPKREVTIDYVPVSKGQLWLRRGCAALFVIIGFMIPNVEGILSIKRSVSVFIPAGELLPLGGIPSGGLTIHVIGIKVYEATGDAVAMADQGRTIFWTITIILIVGGWLLGTFVGSKLWCAFQTGKDCHEGIGR